MSRRRFTLTASISADTLDDVMYELRDIVRDVERGADSCTGGLHGGHSFVLTDRTVAAPTEPAAARPSEDHTP